MTRIEAAEQVGLALSSIAGAVQALSFGLTFGISPGNLNNAKERLGRAMSNIDAALVALEQKKRKPTRRK